MNTLCNLSKHSTCTILGIVGCSGYPDVFKNGKLDVFERKDCTTKYNILRVRLPGSKYVGYVIICANQYK